MANIDSQRSALRPVIVAHSGCMGTPTNSLESIYAAIHGGADAIEFDLQATRDCVPVLMHDESFQTTTGVPVKIASLNAAEIPYNYAHFGGARTPPPDLETVCTICRRENLMLNLDVKDPRAIPRMLEIVKRVGSVDSTFVTGCRLEHQEGPPPVAPLSGLVNIEPGAGTPETEPGFEPIIERIAHWGWSGVNVKHVELTPALVEAAHRHGLGVGAWTVDTATAIDRVITLKCDYITSNYPDRVRHVYNLSGKKNRSMEDV